MPDMERLKRGRILSMLGGRDGKGGGGKLMAPGVASFKPQGKKSQWGKKRRIHK